MTSSSTPTSPPAADDPQHPHQHQHGEDDHGEDDHYHPSLLSQVIDISKCVLGIYASFIVLSLLQERITRKPYDGEYFDYPLILVFFQCVFNALYAYIMLSRSKKKQNNNRQNKTSTSVWQSHIPMKWYALIGFSYVAATSSSNVALMFVNYPTQVLAKSCKVIPVMVMGVLVARKKYPLRTYVVVMLLSVGMSIFMIDKYAKHKKTTDENSYEGLLLLLFSLAMDGITNSFQTRLQMQFKPKPTADELMLYMNAFAVGFLTIAIAVSGQAPPAFEFCMRHPDTLVGILLSCVCMTVGQIFIFWTITSYGTLVTSIITTTRKFFTILLSVFWFGHEVTTVQWSGIALVFVALIWDTFESVSAERAKQKQRLMVLSASSPALTADKQE